MEGEVTGEAAGVAEGRGCPAEAGLVPPAVAVPVPACGVGKGVGAEAEVRIIFTITDASSWIFWRFSRVI